MRGNKSSRKQQQKNRQFSPHELKRLLRYNYAPAARAVKWKRSGAGPMRRSDGGQEWTYEEIKLLGKNQDAETARLLRRTKSSVVSKRQKLGIASFTPWLRPWSKAELRLLGKLTDAEVARRTGHTVKAAGYKRRLLHRPKIDPLCRPWTKKEDALLGRMSDQEAARRTQRSIQGVRYRRGVLGMGDIFDRKFH